MHENEIKTIQVGKIFDLIKEKEGVEFELDKQYIPKTKFEVETAQGYKPVAAMMIKTDVTFDIITDKGNTYVSKDHIIIKADGTQVKVKSLEVGDELFNTKGPAKILEIKPNTLETVYDITLGDSEDSLYLDANGFQHHNTYHVKQTLKRVLGPETDKWFYHSGAKAAPFSFYKTMFMERNAVVVWDEADSLLKNDDIIMMLKPALDTSGDNYFEYTSGTRNVNFLSKEEIEDASKQVEDAILSGKQISTVTKGDKVQLPSKFRFNGSMIFISNMRAKQMEGAILSRSLFIDVYLAERDVVKRIRSIGEAQFGKEVTAELLEALTGVPADKFGNQDNLETGDEEIVYMTPEYARKNKPITVRSLGVAKALKDSGLSNWATLAAMYG